MFVNYAFRSGKQRAWLRLFLRSGESLVFVVTGPRVGRSGVQTPAGTDKLLCLPKSRCYLEPTFLLWNGYQGVFAEGIKQPERETNHPCVSNTKVKNVSSYTSTPPYAFVACRGTTYHLLYSYCYSLLLRS
jgi:hypothetical protein